MAQARLRLAAVGDVALLRPPTTFYRGAWDGAELRLANLEAPLAEGGVPAPKLIRLQSPPAAGGWLRDMGCDAVSLANNHAMDLGVPGLQATLAALDEAGVRHAGAGEGPESAGAATILDAAGWRVALLSWACTLPPGFQAAPGRPGVAGVRVRSSYAADSALLDEQPGTPPWVSTEVVAGDEADLAAALQKARRMSDFVVLALHWGVPPQWSSPHQGPLAEYQPGLGRRLIAAGADLILGHHAHTVYGLEQVPRAGEAPGLICYSLGNFIFHPLGRPAASRLLAPLWPYRAADGPLNRETYVAEFTLRPGTAGRLAVASANLDPATLDEEGTAQQAPAPGRRAIAERVAAFSRWRGTETEVVEGRVTWRAG